MRRFATLAVPAVLAALLAAAAAPALAQGTGYGYGYTQSAHRFELTPQVQYRFGGTLSGEDNTFFDEDLDLNDGEAFGVTFDIPLSSSFQLELLASQQSTELRFDQGLFGGDADIADLDVTYFHVGVLVQGDNPEVTPFFVASAGATRLDPDVPGADTESRFSASLGGGVKVFFSRNVGLRFEGRGFWTAIDDSDDDFCDRGCDWDDYDNDDLTQGQASIGLIVAW